MWKSSLALEKNIKCRKSYLIENKLLDCGKAIALLKKSNSVEIHMGDKNNFVEIKIFWTNL